MKSFSWKTTVSRPSSLTNASKWTRMKRHIDFWRRYDQLILQLLFTLPESLSFSTSIFIFTSIVFLCHFLFYAKRNGHLPKESLAPFGHYIFWWLFIQSNLLLNSTGWLFRGWYFGSWPLILFHYDIFFISPNHYFYLLFSMCVFSLGTSSLYFSDFLLFVVFFLRLSSLLNVYNSLTILLCISLSIFIFPTISLFSFCVSLHLHLT